MSYQQRKEQLDRLKAQYQEALKALKEAELALKWFEAVVKEQAPMSTDRSTIVLTYRGFTIGQSCRIDYVVAYGWNEATNQLLEFTATHLHGVRYAIDRHLDGPESAPLYVPVSKEQGK